MVAELYLKGASHRLTSAQDGLGQKLTATGLYGSPGEFNLGAHRWLEHAAQWMRDSAAIEQVELNPVQTLPQRDGYHPPIWTDVTVNANHNILVVQAPVVQGKEYDVRVRLSPAAIPDDITQRADEHVDVLHQVEMDLIYEYRFSSVKVYLLLPRKPQQKHTLIDSLFELYGVLHQHKRIMSPPQTVHPSLLC